MRKVTETTLPHYRGAQPGMGTCWGPPLPRFEERTGLPWGLPSRAQMHQDKLGGDIGGAESCVSWVAELGCCSGSTEKGDGCKKLVVRQGWLGRR
jgi:hypothetical protein